MPILRTLWAATLILVTSSAAADEVIPPPTPRTGWLKVEIGAVRVSATHPGTTLMWDGAAPVKGDDGCQVIAATATILGAGVGGAAVATGCKLLAGLSSTDNKQRERHPELPDLFVSMIAGRTTYSTPVSADSESRIFDYTMILPLSAVPASGLRFAVRDADGVDHDPEDIGDVLVSKEQILNAASTGSPVELKDDRGAVQRIVITFAIDGDPQAAGTSAGVDVSMPMRRSSLHVLAGQTVFLQAKGRYTVGRDGLLSAGLSDPIGPAGFPDGRGRQYNLATREFQAAPHGAAIAVVDDGRRQFEVVIGECVGFVSPISGTIMLGVNDSDTRNNRGSLHVLAMRSNAKPDEWARPGRALPCPTEGARDR